jgi:hypothetical protein
MGDEREEEWPQNGTKRHEKENSKPDHENTKE